MQNRQERRIAERETTGLQETQQVRARVQPPLVSRTLDAISLDLCSSEPWLLRPALLAYTLGVTEPWNRKAFSDMDVPLLTSLPLSCPSFLLWPDSGLITCTWAARALHLHNHPRSSALPWCKCSCPKTLVCKVWPWGQKHQYHLRTC